MSLFNLHVGQSATVRAIKINGAAAARANALGIVCGARITLLAFGLFKNTVLAGVGLTRVSLRRSVACNIEVEV